MEYAVTVLAVGTDGLGMPVFDIRDMYQEEKGVPLADECSYGIMIEDLPSALEELLLHLEDPYAPGGDQGPYTD